MRCLPQVRDAIRRECQAPHRPSRRSGRAARCRLVGSNSANSPPQTPRGGRPGWGSFCWPGIPLSTTATNVLVWSSLATAPRKSEIRRVSRERARGIRNRAQRRHLGSSRFPHPVHSLRPDSPSCGAVYSITLFAWPCTMDFTLRPRLTHGLPISSIRTALAASLTAAALLARGRGPPARLPPGRVAGHRLTG